MTVTDVNKRLPADAEKRLEQFAELLGTAIANADSRAELAASRARIIAAGDEARRRIERDLHDGAQQRLITLTVALRRADAKLPTGADDVRADLTRVAEGLTTAVDELRELSRGIHPSILTEGGLSPALKALGRRSPVRVKLDTGFERRLPDHVEAAAYYTVSEALTKRQSTRTPRACGSRSVSTTTCSIFRFAMTVRAAGRHPRVRTDRAEGSNRGPRRADQDREPVRKRNPHRGGDPNRGAS